MLDMRIDKESRLAGMSANRRLEVGFWVGWTIKVSFLSSLFFFSVSSNAFGQYATQDYFFLIYTPDTLFKAKKYCEAAFAYSDVFGKFENKGSVEARYNAACSYAVCGIQDSAFSQLARLVGKGKYDKYHQLEREKKLHILHCDARWDTIINSAKRNAEYRPMKYPKLKKELEKISRSDQDIRIRWQELVKKNGRDSEAVQAFRATMLKTDASNLARIKDIIATYGWLGVDQVGREANAAFFLVIQHADHATRNHFLPLMRSAVKAGKAFSFDLALLEDRILVDEGKDQLYGSQVGYDDTSGESCVFSIADADNVDVRRQQVGLGPISNYLRPWGIVWDPKNYKKCSGN